MLRWEGVPARCSRVPRPRRQRTRDRGTILNMEMKLETRRGSRLRHRPRQGLLRRPSRLHRRPRCPDERRTAIRAVDSTGFGLLVRVRERHRRYTAGFHAGPAVGGSRRSRPCEPNSIHAGGVEVTEVQEFPWGKFVYFSDPDGNGWSLQLDPTALSRADGHNCDPKRRSTDARQCPASASVARRS